MQPQWNKNRAHISWDVLWEMTQYMSIMQKCFNIFASDIGENIIYIFDS